MNPKALQKISYGMHTLTSGKDSKLKGQIVNAVARASVSEGSRHQCTSRAASEAGDQPHRDPECGIQRCRT